MIKDTEKKYWHDFYHGDKVVSTNNMQTNVGRTKKGVPVSDENWAKAIEYIAELVKISKNDTVLELCCGNGQVIGNLASKCKKSHWSRFFHQSY